MNFNPNAMMKKQVEKMISQRFGSVDNMMNDMSKFAGNKYVRNDCCKYRYRRIAENYHTIPPAKSKKAFLNSAYFLCEMQCSIRFSLAP